ncbi:MAG: hypothetical protein Q9183_000863, partial [Haloplaca sp. 2 TL-2023]
NLAGITALYGETDLEAPDWTIGKWGSILLMELAPPSKNANVQEKPWHADIPLHLRYLPPSAGGMTEIEVPWPVVFWACPVDEGMVLDGNPFESKGLGYDAMFDKQTVFYHWQPEMSRPGQTLVETLKVPVMDLEKTTWVEGGTVGVVVLGAIWVVWYLVRLVMRDYWRGMGQREKKKRQ